MKRPSPDLLKSRMHPDPVTDEQRELANRIDPADYEVYHERLKNICSEAKEVFVRTGISWFIRSGDLSITISTPEGDVVTGYCGLNHPVPVIPAIIKTTIDLWRDEPTVGIHDGDGFYCNADAYGSSHAPDQYLAVPIFYEGELVAWGQCSVHEPDIGAKDPGGMVVGAINRYEEGMKIPPFKVVDRGVINLMWLEMCQNMVRTPDMFEQDFRARLSGTEILKRRMIEICDEMGKDFLKGLLYRIRIDAEEMARKIIATWNDGIYRTLGFCELSGLKPGLKRVFTTMTKEGDHIKFDQTGSSPEDESSWNSMQSLNYGMPAQHMYSAYFWDLPLSNATWGPLEVFYEEGSVFKPHPEAATSCGSVFIGCVQQTTWDQSIYKAMYDSDRRDVIRGCDGNAAPLSLAAGVNQWGRVYADMLTRTLNGAGQGARSYMDGMDVFSCGWGPAAGRIPDNEEEEAQYPFVVLMFGRVKDGFGHGKYRGGSNYGWCFVVHGADYLAVIPLGTGGHYVVSQQGLFGGYPAPTVPIGWIRETNVLEQLKAGKKLPGSVVELLVDKPFEGKYEITDGYMPPKVLFPGEVFIHFTQAGSGYGDCLERDPELVVRDLRDGMLSEWAAENVYHVAYHPETLIVDYDKTKQMRDAERKARLEKGKPYDEFMKEWSKLTPPEEILFSYGSWPDAKQTRTIIRV